MSEFCKKNKGSIIFVLVNLIVFVIMLAINSIYPFYWDDVDLVKGFDLNNWNVAEVFVKTYYRFYLNWSGKLLPLSLATIFTLLDKTVYNIVNSVMYVIFANVILRFFWKKKNDYWMLIAIYAALWIFIPWFGTVIFWVDGTVEYLWMLIPVLLFGGIYFKNYFGYDTKKRSIVGMFLLGLLSGCGLEATGSALIFGLGVMTVVKIVQKKKMLPWEISGIVGELIGFASLMLAPGNYNRASTVVGMSDIYSNFIYRFGRETYFYLVYMTPIMGIAIALTVLMYRSKKVTGAGISDGKSASGRSFKKWIVDVYVTCRESIVLMVLAVVSVYVMTFVSAFASRVFLTPTALFVMAGGVAIRRISETDMGAEIASKYGNAIKTLLFFVAVFVLMQMISAFVFGMVTGDPVTKNVQYTNVINDVRLFD